MKTINIIKIATTTVGGLLEHFLGGFDAMLVTLITFYNGRNERNIGKKIIK